MHVAIIMDGNGRWATRRGLPRTAGHIEGAKAVRAAVEAAVRANVKILTLYAFSSANWARPPAEIAALMRLFGQYLFTETRRCVEQSIRINVIGRRDRLGQNLLLEHGADAAHKDSSGTTAVNYALYANATNGAVVRLLIEKTGQMDATDGHTPSPGGTVKAPPSKEVPVPVGVLAPEVPAVVALFLYSLLPIVRNTHAGLCGIPTPPRMSLRPSTRA